MEISDPKRRERGDLYSYVDLTWEDRAAIKSRAEALEGVIPVGEMVASCMALIDVVEAAAASIPQSSLRVLIWDFLCLDKALKLPTDRLQDEARSRRA